MVYIFDTSSLHVFRSYFPERFPSFWERLEETIESETVRSVREVRRELENQNKAVNILKWAKKYSKEFFPIPSREETAFIAKIFEEKHFRQLVGQKTNSKGLPSR